MKLRRVARPRKIPKTGPTERSDIMRAVNSTNTAPERFVRQLLHRFGYRFRLHSRQLPGKPDIVFRARQKVVIVHGCFWHGHGCPRGTRVPKTNTESWRAKIEPNRLRDANVAAELSAAGWEIATVWECEIRNESLLTEILVSFLGPPRLSYPSSAPR